MIESKNVTVSVLLFFVFTCTIGRDEEGAEEEEDDEDPTDLRLRDDMADWRKVWIYEELKRTFQEYRGTFQEMWYLWKVLPIFILLESSQVPANSWKVHHLFFTIQKISKWYTSLSIIYPPHR